MKSVFCKKTLALVTLITLVCFCGISFAGDKNKAVGQLEDLAGKKKETVNVPDPKPSPYDVQKSTTTYDVQKSTTTTPKAEPKKEPERKTEPAKTVKTGEPIIKK